MAGNTTGKIFRLTSFGESHGKAIGGVIDGCPAGLEIDFEAIAKDMARRKPGQSDLTTARTEEDQVDWLSGIFEGKTTGTPIAFTIPNKDQRSKDYSQVKDVFRPSHADYTYEAKYGLRDYRGGGRSSARETAVRVAAGAIAKQLLEKEGVNLRAFVTSVGTIDMELPIDQIDWQQAENELRCPDTEASAKMREAIFRAKEAKDSLGGIITCVVKGVPPGLGEPVFDKIHAELGKALLGINAVKGFEIGSGFAGTRMPGSAHNDAFTNDGGSVGTATNHSGGVQGGITNGMDIVCRIAFKPVASIGKNQQTVNKDLEETELALEGRHDPCVVPRAVPIVEAMAALVLTDHLLRNRTARI